MSRTDVSGSRRSMRSNNWAACRFPHIASHASSSIGVRMLAECGEPLAEDGGYCARHWGMPAYGPKAWLAWSCSASFL